MVFIIYSCWYAGVWLRVDEGMWHDTVTPRMSRTICWNIRRLSCCELFTRKLCWHLSYFVNSIQTLYFQWWGSCLPSCCNVSIFACVLVHIDGRAVALFLLNLQQNGFHKYAMNRQCHYQGSVHIDGLYLRCSEAQYDFAYHIQDTIYIYIYIICMLEIMYLCFIYYCLVVFSREK